MVLLSMCMIIGTLVGFLETIKPYYLILDIDIQYLLTKQMLHKNFTLFPLIKIGTLHRGGYDCNMTLTFTINKYNKTSKMLRQIKNNTVYICVKGKRVYKLFL